MLHCKSETLFGTVRTGRGAFFGVLVSHPVLEVQLRVRVVQPHVGAALAGGGRRVLRAAAAALLFGSMAGSLLGSVEAGRKYSE